MSCEGSTDVSSLPFLAVRILESSVLAIPAFRIKISTRPTSLAIPSANALADAKSAASRSRTSMASNPVERLSSVMA